ncbi:TylF/MycF/NovP-related O-methyltransferase [Desulfallas thermosapovorans]|uniref:O-methyltransferase n=1 Tax=Desulfallas thermosapovorans DSM 6562 TaxID=1121431 RepID=A0A5S4ZXF5_9FIRM|nr:TylF/MycF/NovP-related O-methyltransferase [Desulfallas thermosapovorans]TYO96930.1 O-methyltransferase [Desulfallas thermosapovorans DSM 6562]
MNKTVIWGAGQGGKMLRHLLGSDVQVVAFCDNNKKLHGTMVEGIPVVNVERLKEIQPDCVYIAILNKEACLQVREQLINLAINCRITSITEFREQFDIRLAVLRLIAKEIKNRNIEGALAELGVFQGKFAAEMNRIFPDRKIYLFDTFEGFDERDIKIESENEYSRAKTGKFSDTSVEMVCSMLPFPEQAIIKKGYFPNTAEGLVEEFALVSLDADLYQPTYEGLKYFHPRVTKGGYIIIHDYNSAQFSGAGKAVDRYCRENNIFVVPLCDLHGSAVIVKT